MEDSKPTYEEVESELNEYKELLWQLSDEYKVNLGAAETEIQLLKDRCKVLEDGGTIASLPPEKEPPKEEVTEDGGKKDPAFVEKLGLPACILDNEGKILRYNNKFKFLVELLSFEIEDVDNISFLLSRDTDHKLLSKYESFKVSEEGQFQSVFKVKSAFQGLINILLRVYNVDESNEALALFVELNRAEIQNLVNTPVKLQELPDEAVVVEQGTIDEPKIKVEPKTKDEPEFDEDFGELLKDITIFAEKYEVFKELVENLGLKGKKKDIANETIYKGVVDTFSLTGTRKKLLEKLDTQFKNFSHKFNNKFPTLTSNEEKHCLLIKAGLTYKEIASLMNISINGVKIARNRLRKKLELENETKTSDFIDRF